MTFKEKLLKENPKCIGEQYLGECCGCPIDYGYEKQRPTFCEERKNSFTNCKMCWNREIPVNTKKLCTSQLCTSQWESKIELPKVIHFEEKQFTKADLKVGHIVEYRNGKRRLVLRTSKGDLFLASYKHHNELFYYDYNLMHKDGMTQLDVVKVYEITKHDNIEMLLENLNLIWERKEPTIMSISEAETLVEKLTGEKIKIK